MVGHVLPDPVQHLLNRADRDIEAVRDILQRSVVEVSGEQEAMGVVDEIGFIKRGDRPVGVKQQYSGTEGYEGWRPTGC